MSVLFKRVERQHLPRRFTPLFICRYEVNDWGQKFIHFLQPRMTQVISGKLKVVSRKFRAHTGEPVLKTYDLRLRTSS